MRVMFDAAAANPVCRFCSGESFPLTATTQKVTSASGEPSMMRHGYLLGARCHHTDYLPSQLFSRDICTMVTHPYPF